MKSIIRNTEVVSISLPLPILSLLERERKNTNQSRSAYLASLISEKAEDDRWKRIYAWGGETAKKFKITSEEDIENILNES